MKTLIISNDGTCLEFNTKKKGAPDKLLEINMEKKCAAFLSGTWPIIQVISFEGFHIGERLATGKKVLFLRGNSVLFEFSVNNAIAATDAVSKLKDLLEADQDDNEHKPVC